MPAPVAAAAATPYGAIALGTLALASSLMGESAENRAMEQKAREHGTRRAGIADAQTGNVNTFISAVAAARDNLALHELDIDAAQANAEANARVNAAQAGVEGGSVEMVLQETETNAAKATANVKRQATANEEQAKQSLVNTNVGLESSKGTLDATTFNKDIQHTLAFASGFISGFGGE